MRQMGSLFCRVTCKELLDDPEKLTLVQTALQETIQLYEEEIKRLNAELEKINQEMEELKRKKQKI